MVLLSTIWHDSLMHDLAGKQLCSGYKHYIESQSKTVKCPGFPAQRQWGIWGWGIWGCPLDYWLLSPADLTLTPRRFSVLS